MYIDSSSSESFFISSFVYTSTECPLNLRDWPPKVFEADILDRSMFSGFMSLCIVYSLKNLAYILRMNKC